MTFKFPSDEWIKELSSKLNESEAYEKSAKDWEGDFVFVVDPDDAYDSNAYLYLGLYHGKSPDAAELASQDERETEFVLRAPFSNWRKVIEGKLDPIQGMITGQLKLKGPMGKIMRFPKAASELVNCATKVPTEFPG